MLLSLLLAALPQDHAGHSHAKPPARLAPPADDKAQHLGFLKPGEVRTFTWEVKHTGAAPARYRLTAPPQVKVAEADLAAPFAPGEARNLAITLDTKGLRGFHGWILKLQAEGGNGPVHEQAVDLVAVSFAVDPDKVQSLGSVGPREIKTVTWEIRNLADIPQTFRLLDLAPGTTVAEGPLATPLAPGEARTLAMTINPTDFVGYQRRAAKLEVSDPQQPRYILRTDMTVRPEMAVDGSAKDLGGVAPHETPQIVFTFTREGGDPARIKLATTLPDWFEPEVVNEGARSELRLTFRPRLLKPGVHAGLELLTVETNAPREPKFALSLAWHLALPVIPTPAKVVFDSPKAERQTLVLKAREGKPFRILTARVDGPAFTIGAPPATSTAEQTLTITRVAKAEARGILTLTFEGEDAPLQIPLAYLPPSAPAKPRKR